MANQQTTISTGAIKNASHWNNGTVNTMIGKGEKMNQAA